MESHQQEPSRPIAIAEPDLGHEVEDLVIKVLRSGRLSQGPMTAEFERLCAGMAGTTEAVAMVNGSVTLEAALNVLGIGPGDEVITSGFTFVATLSAILARGATARFADIAPDLTLDPRSVEDLIGPNTAAILPVHLFGLPADMPRLLEVAERHGLAIIEDCAQAHGASCGARRVGSYGLGSFSFYATKNVTAGEGGVVTTSDTQLAEELRLVRNHGMNRRYAYERRGSNLRLSELHAAVAIPQLKRLDEINGNRGVNAQIFQTALDGLGLTLPRQPEERRHVWHQYTILLPQGVDRDAFVVRLNDDGIGARVYYPRPVFAYPPFEEEQRVVKDDVPNTEEATRRCVSLPVHQNLRRDEIDRIIETTRLALE